MVIGDDVAVWGDDKSAAVAYNKSSFGVFAVGGDADGGGYLGLDDLLFVLGGGESWGAISV